MPKIKFSLPPWEPPSHSARAKYERLVSRLLDRDSRRAENDYICPTHPDNRPSLGVTLKDGKVLVYCQAGCETKAVLAAVGMRMSDLFDGPTREKRIVETYGYTDANEKLLFEVVRYDPKEFRQRRPDGNGGYVWNVKDVPRVLYHLPHVNRAIARKLPIYVVEGEKDVHAVEAAGGVATTSPMGAGKWRDDYTQMLRGASEVIVVADKGDQTAAGERHAEAVAAALTKAGVLVRIVQARQGKDSADHLAAGFGLDDFVPYVATAAEGDPEHALKVAARMEAMEVERDARAALAAKGFVFPTYHHSMIQELAADREPLTYTIEGLHNHGGNTLFVAQFKAGKTTLEMNVAQALCDETMFLARFDVLPLDGKRVAFWDYELVDVMFDDWFEALDFQHPERITALHLRGQSRVPFTDPHVQNEVIAYLKEEHVGFWFIDGASKVMADAGIESENDNIGITRLTDAIDYIKSEADVADCVVSGHWGRDKMREGSEHIRGATRWDDWADNRWSLSRDDDDTRHFSALDVRGVVPELALALSFDDGTRRLTSEGHTRDEHRELSGAMEATRVVAAHPGIGAGALGDALKGDKRAKLEKVRSALTKGWITEDDMGSGKAKPHHVVEEMRKEWEA